MFEIIYCNTMYSTCDKKNKTVFYRFYLDFKICF